MPATPARPDVASIRLDNAHALFDEFVRATVRHPDAATLRGLEGRFAERLQIQASYWSQIKSRSRQIGERLARQFERLCHKPPGWMDVAHDAQGALAEPAPVEGAQPHDDDERFIVGLVLTYYRRHPQRARGRLLELLGEVLGTPAGSSSPPPVGAQKAVAGADERELWARARSAVAPLKQKR